MDARLNDEQRMLRESAARLAADLGPRTPAELPPSGPDGKRWAQLAEAGLLGMRLPESADGMPTSGLEVVLVAEELARRLVPLPFVGSAVFASALLAAAGAGEEPLRALGEGSLRLAPVLDPGLGRLAGRGEAGIAWEASGAAAGLVIDRETRRLCALRPRPERMPAIDLTRELREVPADAEPLALGDLGDPLAEETLDRVLALTLAALSADLVGIMQAALDAAVAHARERVQFGAPIGSFQAVQHLAAEAAVSTEAARGLAWYAGWAVDELEPREALLAARTAKAYCAEHAREVVETSMQIHGGVAFTWEYLVHVMVRRVLLGRQTLGDEHVQLEAIAGLRAAPRR